MSAQREAFEVHAERRGLPFNRYTFEPFDYCSSATHEAWIAWQAAQAAMPAAPVKPEVVPSTCAEAYSIYIPDQQSVYVVESLDEATDDLTNEECEITPLYPAYSGAFAVQAAMEADAARYRYLRALAEAAQCAEKFAEWQADFDAEIARTGGAA